MGNNINWSKDFRESSVKTVFHYKPYIKLVKHIATSNCSKKTNCYTQFIYGVNVFKKFPYSPVEEMLRDEFGYIRHVQCA